MKNTKILEIYNKLKMGFIPLLVLLILIIVFSLVSPAFTKIDNFLNIIFFSTINGLMAIGITFLLITGNFDLSIGAIMTLGAAVAVGFQNYFNLPIYLACICAISVGMFIGLINGLIVTKGKVNSFIATLGMSLMLDGFVLIFLKNSSLLGINKEYVYISDGKLFFINFPIWLLIIALIISYLILKRSILGRRFYAIGGNDYICKVFGINTDFYKIIAFIICGMLSSFSGIILSSHLNMISPDFGKTTMLIVISAVVFGGTSLKGGEGGIVNSYISVLIFTILANGFGLLGIGMYYQQYIWGFAIIAVLTIDKYKHKVEYKI